MIGENNDTEKTGIGRLLNSNGALLLASGIFGLIGDIYAADAAEERLEKELRVKNREIDAQLRIAAQKYGLDLKQLMQQKELFIQNLRETARQFDAQLALKSTETALSARTAQAQTDLAYKKFGIEKEQVQEALSQKRRGRNALRQAWTPVPNAPGPRPPLPPQTV